MPQACTRMRTCPADGCGISRSTISKSAPGFGTIATFIFAMETLRFFSGFTPGTWMHASGKPTHIMPLQSQQARSKIAQRAAKKFCRDFRGDAQALGLTRARLPRTMRHRFEHGSVRTQKEKFSACPPAEIVVQKRRKGEYKTDLSCLLTRPSRSRYRITWMR